MTANVEVEQRS